MTTKFIAVAALLLGSTAFACPDLSGTYVCEQDGQKTENVVAQSEAAGVTTYTATEDGETTTLVADGKPYTEVETEEDYVYTTTTVATCAADALNLDINLDLTDKAGNKMMTVKAKAVVSLDANKNLQLVTTDDQSGQTQTQVCVRK
jgi:hypothetical protein